MAIELIHTNIVVLAQGHNPTILHPSFLERTGIVPAEYVPVADQIITTPAFSKVVFENGIEFFVQGDRLQVSDFKASLDSLERVNTPSLVLKYLQALPHVPYAAVGVNFFGFLKKGDPGPYLRDRFLKEGPWSENADSPSGADVRLFYNLQGVRLQAGISSGVAPSGQQAGAAVGVSLDFNYHHDLDMSAPLADAERFLARFQELAKDYIVRTKTIVE